MIVFLNIQWDLPNGFISTIKYFWYQILKFIYYGVQPKIPPLISFSGMYQKLFILRRNDGVRRGFIFYGTRVNACVRRLVHGAVFRVLKLNAQVSSR